MRRSIIVLSVIVLALAQIALAAPPPTTQPQTQAKVSADARQILDQATAAYAKLKSLELAGTVTVDLKIQGEQPKIHSIPFTATFAAPNRFRHDAKDDVLLGSTGAKLYTFKPDKNAYTLADAPKDRVQSSDLPHDLATVLFSQDPSLLLAMCKNAAEELLDDVEEVQKVADTKLGDISYATLTLKMSDQSTETILFDPQTHLMRRAANDLTSNLKKRRPDLISATVTTDYTQMKVDEPSKDQSFAWTPPAGSIDADTTASAHPLEVVAASSLEGKAAPDFKLPRLDGKSVSLASLKGHIIVLDFWATWCGPCRISLPHLQKLYEAEKERGVEVFAINQQEEQSDVEAFVKETKLAVPVLLDREGKASEAYGVEGLPQSVVIDKDGKIKKIVFAFVPSSPDELITLAG
jgi:peroxiredoxin